MGSGASKRKVNPKLPVQNVVFTPVKQNIETRYSSDSSRTSSEQDKESGHPDAYDISSNVIMPVASNVGNGLRRRIQHILSSPFSESSPSTSNFGSSSSNNKNLHSNRVESKTGEYIHHVGGYTDSEIECNSDMDNNSYVDVRAKTLSIVFQMLPHHQAPTMTDTIMSTLKPLFQLDNVHDNSYKHKENFIIYCLKHQEEQKGDTLLIAACRYQMNELFDFLFGFKEYLLHHINIVNFDGQAALHIACTAESLSFQKASKLVTNGAAIGVIDNEGCTSLHFAASAGNVDVTKLLMNKRIPNCVDIYGYTALDYALSYCHYDCANILKEHFPSAPHKGYHQNNSDNNHHHEEEDPLNNNKFNSKNSIGNNFAETWNEEDANMATRSIGDWVEYWCYENEDYYYYNNQSQETQWEKPQVFVDNDAEYENQQGERKNVELSNILNSDAGSAEAENKTMFTPKQKKIFSPFSTVTPTNHSIINSNKKKKLSPVQIFKKIATSIGKQRKNQKQHGIATGSPIIIVPTPGKKGNSTNTIRTPANGANVTKHQTSIEKEITKLIRVVHSERSYAEESESMHSGSGDTATAMALKLEKKRLEELREKFDENEIAISNLKHLREKQGETNPETDENDDMHYNKLETQMLLKRSELSKALDEQKLIATRAEEEVQAHRKAYEDAMKKIVEKEEKINILTKEIMEKEEKINKANQKMADNYNYKEESRRLMTEQAKALKEAQALAKQHAKETEKIRQQQAEDKRALVEAKSRILKQKAAEAEQKIMAERLREIEAENLRLKKLETDHNKLKKDFAREHKLRKKVHNELEQMKGSIRVLARMRPLSKSEHAKKCSSSITLPDTTTMAVTVPPKREGGNVTKKEFQFDTCFDTKSNQADVFKHVAPLVQSALDGYNVCIFAYGQTGSGKTYTMSGPGNGVDCEKHEQGITPRATKLLFDVAKENSERFDVEFRLTMIELYRGELQDLLVGKEKKRKRKNKNPTSQIKLSIKKDHNDTIYVENASEIVICNNDDLQHCMEYGWKKRHTAATLMNDSSSRSHLVMTIRLNSTNKITNVETVGKLTLVDLAGSERQSKTGSSGETLKEAQSINSSLSALGNVISAITAKSKHVPYRDSQLTQLLSDSLGGNAKTLMFVNVSPADYNVSETCSSLQFASRVKKVTNKSTKQIENKQIKMLKAKLRQLQQKNI
jgi:hypothetical protein